MKDFPQFMKNRINLIKQSSQFTEKIEGYVYDGLDGSQMAFWTCHEDNSSKEHDHPFDEYIVCVAGRYQIFLNGKKITLNPGDEFLIPAGSSHGGQCIAGTRTIHAFGGKRAERIEEIK